MPAQGKLPSWIGLPAAAAVPFGAFEAVLQDPANRNVAQELQQLSGRFATEPYPAEHLAVIRCLRVVLERFPRSVLQVLRSVACESFRLALFDCDIMI